MSTASVAEILAEPEPEPAADPCAGPDAEFPAEQYDLALHLGSIGILLVVSMVGSLGPVALHLTSRSTAVSTAIRLGTFFGFGSILATAFIHMMLPAAKSFANPCLPAFWTTSYDAWAYLFTLLAVLLMQQIDWQIKGHHLRRRAAQQWHRQQQQYHQNEPEQQMGHEQHSQEQLGDEGHDCQSAHALIISALSHTKGVRMQQAAAAAADGEYGEGRGGGEGAGPCLSQVENLHTPLLPPPPQQHRQQQQQQQQEPFHVAAVPAAASQVMGLYLAEAGIIFHSIMIGLTLGVTSGTSFTTLLVALSFHQFFEGFAIGSAAVDSGLGAVQACAMGLVFSVTTPAGIAVGIAVRESFNSNATAALLAAGICDSLSAGVLLYTVLCELVTPMMTDSPWLRSQQWPLQTAAYLALYAGAATMAAVGKWA
ncbi:hypothetical protein D9Q98_009782 [Chlorella vulgaris]|uniref:Uncharacterized protein n=1 Tax=Chlorella vulgaris TaxID=3077 RepID=A0A9D4TF26_CHLVU|nr:hypothetical protein D9Q98_009782 [Chlorella vulgaris]